MVSAIIPARNEELSIARAVVSVAAQPEIGEVIVVNDQSSDRTADILSELVERIPKLRVLTPGALPAGWTGKNYAVSTGAAAAWGDWLLFTDADTVHMRGSTRRALTDATDHDAVLVSYSPEQETKTFWERALIPFIYCRLAANFSYARINDPKLPDAAANGQFLLILRDVYAAVGGHAAVSGKVLEDVALARRVKERGYGIYFTAPIGIVSTRMYRSFGAMWQGWTKNLYPLMGARPASVLGELGAATPWEPVAIFALFLREALRAHDLAYLSLVSLIILAFCHVLYAAALYRNLFPLSCVQYYLPGACLYTAALITSWWKTTHGSVVWKGREYPAGTA